MNVLSIAGLLLIQLQLATVDGVVTKPGGSEPLGRATVALNPVGPEAVAGRSGITEDDGRFSLKDVLPGDYQLIVETVRYGRLLYGQRRPNGPGVVLTLAAGQHLTGLRLSMTPTGAISGRITNGSGEPAVNASVQALRLSYQNGKRALQVARAGTTDDRGEYRLFGLAPGRYFVSARLNQFASGPYLTGSRLSPVAGPNVVFSDNGLFFISETGQPGSVVNRVLEDGTVEEQSWAPFYYPAATEARFAVPIDVEAGATSSGVNISVGPSRVRRILGRVIGSNAATIQVTLIPQGSASGLPEVYTRGISTQVSREGSFEFKGIFDGDYYLLASDGLNGLVSAPIPVAVGGRDIDGLQIALIPGITVGVVVQLDNPSQNSSGPQPAGGLNVRLIPEFAGLSGLASNGQSQAGTGRVAIGGVTPGNYQIRVLQGANAAEPAKPLHIKAARFGGADARDGIRVEAGTPALLEIVVTQESGAVSGIVNGAGQTIAPGATVVLVPDKGRKRPELYSSTVADSVGGFHFKGIAPGDYRLFAWEDVETGAWQDPDFLRKFEEGGLRVSIAANSRQEVQLSLIRNP